MKKLLKVILPSVFFLVFGILLMFAFSACKKGSCTDCTTSADCPAGLKCYSFSNGAQKCAENAGDICPSF